MKNPNVTLNTLKRALAALLLCAPLAHADVVSDWNEIAVDAIVSLETDPARAARNLATVHIALFEAMNYVEGGYVARYLVKPQRPAGMSGEAAAAAAAHSVLEQLYPARKAAFDAGLERSLPSSSRSIERAAAFYTGGSLGSIVAMARSGAAERDAVSRNESVADAVAWSAAVGRHARAVDLKQIDKARLFAVAGLASDDAHAAARRIVAEFPVQDPCISCVAASAVQTLLAAQPLRPRSAAVAVASLGAVSLPAAQRRAQRAADAVGRKIGEEALRYYPRAR